MYFKRPSFRNGGRGTGIEQLTPRVKASMGFPNFGVSRTASGEPQVLQMRSRPYKESKGLAELFLGPRYTDPNFVSPFLKPDSPFFSNKTGLEFLNLGANDSGSTTFMTSEGPKTIEEVKTEKITSNAGDLDETVTGVVRPGEGVSYNVKEKITENNNNNNLDELLGETSMKDSIEGEVDILKDLLNIIRDKDNIIIDELHKTLPILTKYEKTRILGIRIKQLNNGALPYVKTSEDILDNYIIAERELKEKKIPFIIQRPLPNNTFEYWRLEDLEIL